MVSGTVYSIRCPPCSWAGSRSTAVSDPGQHEEASIVRESVGNKYSHVYV